MIKHEQLKAMALAMKPLEGIMGMKCKDQHTGFTGVAKRFQIASVLYPMGPGVEPRPTVLVTLRAGEYSDGVMSNEYHVPLQHVEVLSNAPE